MRWALVLALVLAGCEVGGFVTHEIPPTPPPPVAVAPGTLVVDTWQFRNGCPRVRDIGVWRKDVAVFLAGNAATAPAEVFQAAVRCAAGESLCYGGSDDLLTRFPAISGCASCAPGVRAAIEIGCAP